MELGLFVGKLGRNCVFVHYVVVAGSNFEFPSDYNGIIYIPFDNGGSWKFDLAKHIKTLDYNIDMHLL